MLDLTPYLGHHSPGYVIEIFHAGTHREIIAGHRTARSALPCTADTLYDIASLTKVYTATLVYLAHEEGSLDLDARIADLDRRFANLQDTKIIDLLSHRQDVWTHGYLGDARTKEEFYQILSSAYIKSPTPTYADVHYIILSTILEGLYQLDFADLLQTKLLDRLRLTQTTTSPVGSNIAANSDPPHDLGLVHDPKARTARPLGITTGHAALFTTGRDLLSFLETFLDDALLSPATLQQMLTRDRGNPYNHMGTRPVDDRETVIEFSGYTGPAFLIDFSRKIIIVVMCNVLPGSQLSRTERKRLTTNIIQEIYTPLRDS